MLSLIQILIVETYTPVQGTNQCRIQLFYILYTTVVDAKWNITNDAIYIFVTKYVGQIWNIAQHLKYYVTNISEFTKHHNKILQKTHK